MEFIREYKDFSLITLGNFFFQCGFTSFFLLPLFVKDLGGDAASIGYVMGIFGIASVSTALVSGFLIDRYGQRVFMLLGSALMFLFSLFYLFVSDINAIMYALRLLQGIAFGLFFTSAATAVSYTIPSSIRHSCLTTFGITTIACFSIGPFFGEILIEKFGYQTFFLYASSFQLLAFILCFFSAETTRGVLTGHIFQRFYKVLLSDRFNVLFLVNLMIAVGLGSLVHFFHVHLHDKGLQMGIFFVIYAVVAILIRLVGGKFTDVIERRKIALPALFMMVASMPIAFFVESYTHLILFSVVFSVGYGFAYPTVNTMVIDRAHAGERGTAVGIFNMAYGTGINSSAIILGLIVRDYGYFSMYLSTALFLVAGCVIFTYKYYITAIMGEEVAVE
jgi:MFS family permease